MWIASVPLSGEENLPQNEMLLVLRRLMEGGKLSTGAERCLPRWPPPSAVCNLGRCFVVNIPGKSALAFSNTPVILELQRKDSKA